MIQWILDKADRATVLLLLALSTISVVFVHSATQSKDLSFWSGSGGRQLIFVVVGWVVYFLVSKVDYHDWSDLAFILYGVGMALLVLVLFTHPIANSRSWFSLGGPFRFQPSEPMKTLTVLAAASFLSRSPHRLDFRHLAYLAAFIVAPMGLLLLQPDMGTAVTYVPLFLGLAWVAGLRPKVLVTLAVVAALLAPIGWFMVLKPYQKERIITVFEPDRDPMKTGYQTIQSRIAVGSGEVVGKGLFQGSQSRLEFLPARETDFILAVIAEETGFVGVLVTLGLLLALLMRAVDTAATSQDYLGTLIATGVVVLWAGQIFINTGMVTGVVPTIGVPLPLVSYGGSSVVATFLAFGLVSSVRTGRLVNA